MDTGNIDMGMQVPSFARTEAYDFDASRENFEIYRELSQIAEEIQQCRAANS